MIEIVGRGSIANSSSISGSNRADSRIAGSVWRSSSKRQGNDFLEASGGRARLADIQRDRADPFVGVRLELLRGAQDGDGAIADEIVELLQRALQDAIRLVPRPALRQHRFAYPPDEKRLEQEFLVLMGEDVAVECAIAGENHVEDQPQDPGRLAAVAKSVRRLPQLGQAFAEFRGEAFPKRGGVLDT